MIHHEGTNCRNSYHPYGWGIKGKKLELLKDKFGGKAPMPPYPQSWKVSPLGSSQSLTHDVISELEGESLWGWDPDLWGGDTDTSVSEGVQPGWFCKFWKNCKLGSTAKGRDLCCQGARVMLTGTGSRQEAKKKQTESASSFFISSLSISFESKIIWQSLTERQLEKQKRDVQGPGISIAMQGMEGWVWSRGPITQTPFDSFNFLRILSLRERKTMREWKKHLFANH